MPGIYVHIPFCLRKCDYCDFFSVPTGRGEVPHEAYLRAVLAQLERDAAALHLSGREVATVYCGGGTPSLMPPSFFAGLLAALGRHFRLAADLEVSCEVNPATADARWFEGARGAGITRASIGVQSFQDRHLRALGRIHTAREAMAAIAEAQEAGFSSVSLDLMYAMPAETMADLEEDVRTAMTFQPEHVSAYQLTIEEGTPLARRISPPLCKGREGGVDLPPLTPPYKGGEWVSEDDQLNQMRTVTRMLSRGGWPRYEISNFAKPGFECRHNLNYWRYGEYLGLGAGATSFVHQATLTPTLSPQGRGGTSVFARRWTQVRDVAAYIDGAAAPAESEEIDARTAMAEYCFLGLRTMEGISCAAFSNLFGVPFEEVFGALPGELVQEGLVDDASGRIVLTQRGVELSNRVFERFLPERP